MRLVLALLSFLVLAFPAFAQVPAVPVGSGAGIDYQSHGQFKPAGHVSQTFRMVYALGARPEILARRVRRIGGLFARPLTKLDAFREHVSNIY